MPVDQQFGNQDQVRRLLEEPIKNAEALLRRGPIDIANGSGKAILLPVCGVINKYPFDPNSLQRLSMDQLYTLLGPTRRRLEKLNDDVKPFVLKVGLDIVRQSGRDGEAIACFSVFLESRRSLSETLYPSGSQPPHFSYSLKQTAQQP